MNKLVRTKQPQVLDAINRITKTVYMEALNQSFQDEVEPKTVTFQTVLKVIVEDIRTVKVNQTLQNELGEDYIITVDEQWAFPQWLEILRRNSVYKQDTFKANFGTLSYNDFDSNKANLMIQEVHVVNNKICDPLEVNCNYFWYLQATDMETVSDVELEQLLTPYKLP